MTNNVSQKIVVNCRFLTQPIAGVQRFGIEICRALKKLDTSFIFVTPKNIQHPTIARELEAIAIGNFTGHLWEQVTLVRYVKKQKAVLVSLCNTAPLVLTKQFITIHDLGFIKHPEWYSYAFHKVYTFLIPRIAKKAVHIFTVSNTSKNELITTLSLPVHKISVIYNAVAPVFKKAETAVAIQEDIGTYILSVSSHHPRKNFEKLTAGFLKIKNQDIKLVIVGNLNKHFNQGELPTSERIIYKQDVGDEELIQLYKNASLFVYASIYEGFGIPIIEAATYGINLCVSEIPVFKEICQEQAQYFDPTNIQDIADSIEESLSNPITPNPAFFEKYSWKHSASQLIKEIQKYEAV